MRVPQYTEDHAARLATKFAALEAGTYEVIEGFENPRYSGLRGSPPSRLASYSIGDRFLVKVDERWGEPFGVEARRVWIEFGGWEITSVIKGSSRVGRSICTITSLARTAAGHFTMPSRRTLRFVESFLEATHKTPSTVGDKWRADAPFAEARDVVLWLLECEAVTEGQLLDAARSVADMDENETRRLRRRHGFDL